MSVSGLTPTYNVIRINMGDTDGQSSAGRLIQQQIGFIQATFRDANDAPINNVQCNITFGMQNSDRIPLDYNGKVRCSVPIFVDGKLISFQTVDNIRVFWDNTPGVFLYLVVSQNSNLFENDTPNPIQSFSQSVGTVINQGEVAIGTSATLIRPANANRQSLMIQNIGTTGIPVFIGNSAASTLNAMPLAIGQTIVLDKSTAAVYGDCASTENVRWLEETL